MKTPKISPEKRALWLTFLFAGSLMILRAFSLHTWNFHYTGDYHNSETDLLEAARNFGKFGYLQSHFLPIHTPLESFPQDPRTYYYLHYPALPYWLISFVYNIFGSSESAPRVTVSLISLGGIFLALQAFKLIRRTKENDWKDVGFVALLTLTPVFLCFGDTLYESSLTEVVQWGFLLWALRYLLKDASPLWGAAIYFLNVWLSFEWLLPLFFLFAWLISIREGPPWRKPRHWITIYGLGLIFPISLRLLHNAWALGGLENAIMDFVGVAGVRSAGTGIVIRLSWAQYFAKFVTGIYWFVGPAALLAVASGFSELRRNIKEQKLRTFLLLWGLGSISWQLLMRQHSSIHAFTYIHFANFLLFLGALSGSFLWEKSRPWVIAVLVLMCVRGGMIIESEIFLPFFHGSSRFLAAQLCAEQREDFLKAFGATFSPVAYFERKALMTTPKLVCTKGGALSELILKVYAVVIKGSVYGPPFDQ